MGWEKGWEKGKEKTAKKRGVCIPGIKLDVAYISEKDEEDIKYACDMDGDYLAISFVNSKEDVEAIIFLLYASYTQIMKNINTAVIFHLFFFKKSIKIIKTPHDSQNNFLLRL